MFSYPGSSLSRNLMCGLLISAILGGGTKATRAVTLEFRLACNLGGTCDAGDFFFDNPEALDDLNFAAQFYSPFTDNLTPISAATISFTHPDTGAPGFGLSNFSVAANTLVIYVGGRDLSGNQVGVGGPGGPTGAFARGQGAVTGPTANDFASWGGAMSFDTKTSTGADRNWHFGADSLPGTSQVDFLSVALHELGHVLGFGTSDSLENKVVGGLLQGPASMALYGAPVPMEFSAASNRHAHWGDDVTSPPFTAEPVAALGDSLRLGKRSLLTPLDYAGLSDAGWQVPAKFFGLPGNADGDQDVDGADFLFWQRNYSQFDLWLWNHYYGATSTPPAIAAVPEPGTVVLAVGMAACLAARRRFTMRWQ